MPNLAGSPGRVARCRGGWRYALLRAFVVRSGDEVSDATIKEWVRTNLARYKVPRHIVFAEVPKTSTGKIQKFRLREMAKSQA